MRCFIPSLLCAALIVVAGCTQNNAPVETTDSTATVTESDSSAAVATDNKNCPIMGHTVTADGGTSSWSGKTIGFCCEGCKPKFDELSDDEKTAKLAAADEADHSEHGDHGEPETSDEDATEETQS